MREIEFRGKRKENGEWVYGFYRSYIYRKKKHAWLETIDRIWEIKPETVGQFTGYNDINALRIFEGDRVAVQIHGCTPFEGDIVFSGGAWSIKNNNGGLEYLQHHYRVCAVIGNIHDTPELLDRK